MEFLDILPPQLRDPVLFAVPFFLLLLTIEWAAARKLQESVATGDTGSTADARRPGSGAYLTRDSWASISMGLVSIFTMGAWKFLALLGYAAIYSYLAPWHLPADQWYTWVIAILGVDLLFYAYHRIAHRVRLIWATHQAHHSSQYFNFATALRQKWNNSGEILMWIPLPLLGIPPWMVFFSFSISLIYQFWIHTERIGKLWRPIEFVFNTPSHHRVHHGMDREYLDKNYGGILIIWDRLFGSFQPELFRPHYGLTKPVDAFNIWKLQTREYIAIGRDVRAARGVRDKLGYIFGPPGWLPAGAARAGDQPPAYAPDSVADRRRRIGAGRSVRDVETVFDAHVDPALVDRSLAHSASGSVWLDLPRPDHPPPSGPLTCDLLVIGGGYTGLWSALHAARRHPDRRIVVIEADRIGWAASGRNGGFVDASLTHGFENGKSRWPNELDTLEALGMENLDGMQAEIAELGLDTEWQRTGMLTVATERHQVEWLEQAAEDKQGQLLNQVQVREEVHSPTFLAGLYSPDTCAIVNPAKLALELARACRDVGVEVFEHTTATRIDSGGASLRVDTDGPTITCRQAVLATNVYPSLLRRNRLYTVPVYDYVLATEPLTEAQLDRIGWRRRQGIGDSANQFHYYRLTMDNRIVWGGYDAIYHFGRRVNAAYEDRRETYRRLAAHFFITFPQLDDVRFTHRWAGPIDTNTRFCAHWGLAREGRVAYVNGFTGLGVGATRFAADVCLDLLDGLETPRTRLEMVRKKPLPFPPEPLASVGIQATRWSLDRADHSKGRRNLLLRTLDAVGLGFDS